MIHKKRYTGLMIFFKVYRNVIEIQFQIIPNLFLFLFTRFCCLKDSPTHRSRFLSKGATGKKIEAFQWHFILFDRNSADIHQGRKIIIGAILFHNIAGQRIWLLGDQPILVRGQVSRAIYRSRGSCFSRKQCPPGKRILRSRKSVEILRMSP